MDAISLEQLVYERDEGNAVAEPDFRINSISFGRVSSLWILKKTKKKKKKDKTTLAIESVEQSTLISHCNRILNKERRRNKTSL